MERMVSAAGHPLQEYMLLIDMPAHLRQRIENERLELTQKYNVLQPPTGRPAISLVRFKAVKLVEGKIIQRLQQIAMAEKPFLMELQNYAGYPMHAVFIVIENQQAVLALIKSLKQARALMKAGGVDPYFLLDPQIILAGRLDNDTYIRIMKAYEHKKFAGSFLAEAFLLLKKNEQEKRYELVKRFEFECDPVKRQQAVLF